MFRFSLLNSRSSDTAARLKPPPLDISYVNTKNNVSLHSSAPKHQWSSFSVTPLLQMIKAERRLLATLGFVVHVKHPHKLICAYCFVLRAHHRTDLIQRAWLVKSASLMKGRDWSVLLQDVHERRTQDRHVCAVLSWDDCLCMHLPSVANSAAASASPWQAQTLVSVTVPGSIVSVQVHQILARFEWFNE